MSSPTTSSGSQPSLEPHRITYLKPSLDTQEMSLANRNVWHKFIIFDGAQYRGSEVLRAVVTASEPAIILPIMYTVEGKNKSTFLAKCKKDVIENLVKQGLCVTVQGQELYMDIVLGFLSTHELQVNINKVIAQALYTRYEPIKKIFNLDDFENEKALGSIFCPIHIPKIFDLVLRCSRMGIFGVKCESPQSRLPVRELSLKYNKLTAVILFEKFFSYHLTKLDLRHNQILDVGYLRYFCEFKINELWLDGNPLCAKYTTSQDYIQAVKNVFPYLQKLDGVVIGMETKFVPSIHSNYLGNGLKIPLIKQFIKHFFTLYDQDDRIVMNGLYDRDALFSMTLGTTDAHKEIVKSFTTNRNLLKFVDYAKCHESLFRGPEKIIGALQQQPPTTHNYKTFNIDLLHEDDHYVAISVQGIVLYRLSFCLPMFFNRTFIIVRKEDNEYCIVNDQCHIDGIPANLINEVKLEPKPAPKFVPTVLSVSEKEQLLRFLRELTKMNIRYCYKYLDAADWDIKQTITTFMKNYSVNDVPSEAFK